MRRKRTGECNMDEAIRAKTLAEKKLADKEFASAKKFTLKAQSLYPELDGISQMLTILDVYISAQNKVGGEMDWYGILGVNPSDNDETIRKQYRKLAFALHPNKNQSVGADGAFKLLSEAWSLLSDKEKRLTYNQRRIGGPSAVPGVDSVHIFANRATSKSKSCRTTRMGHASIFLPASDPFCHPDTFWTICHHCKMHYEYLKVYLNHTLLCPNCHKPFLAKESAAPISFSKSAPQQQHQDSSYHAPSSKIVSDNNQHNSGINAAIKHDSLHGSGPHSSNKTSSLWGAFLERGACNIDPSIALKAANVVQRVNERLKRERKELDGGCPLKNKKVDDSEHQISMGNECGTEGHVSGLKTTGFVTDAAYGFCDLSSKSNRTRELTLLETRNMLMQKAQIEIHSKINEWLLKKQEEENKSYHKKLFAATWASKVNGNHASSGKKECQNMNMQELQEPAMSVPDPDFHDFDLDRTEASFQDNQVWSAYDDDDGMPRFYALVHKVLSRRPLEMKISWLNSKTTAEFGKIDWIGSGFRKTCGEFRVGKFELNKCLNSFSQNVEWAKTPRGSVLIYPRKGEVWALYRNWSHDWNEHIPDHVIHQYEMVQVLDDYNEEHGVAVGPLVRLSGFRTVFHPHTEQGEVKKIPKEEMFRFSHQVPKYLLTGEEALNSPKGHLELDPAAASVELIQTGS